MKTYTARTGNIMIKDSSGDTCAVVSQKGKILYRNYEKDLGESEIKYLTRDYIK